MRQMPQWKAMMAQPKQDSTPAKPAAPVRTWAQFERLSVTGCNNATVSNIIKGHFVKDGSNHSKPVFRKEQAAGSSAVLIYFWDERDGPAYCGWWFGPKVGGDQVWAYNG